MLFAKPGAGQRVHKVVDRFLLLVQLRFKETMVQLSQARELNACFHRDATHTHTHTTGLGAAVKPTSCRRLHKLKGIGAEGRAGI